MIGFDILYLLFLVGFTFTGVQWANWNRTLPNLDSPTAFPLSDSIVNGNNYSYILTGTASDGFGSQGTVTLTITSGAFPSGLTLGNVIYGVFPQWSVVLSGIPDIAGNYSGTILADNGGDFNDTANFSFLVSVHRGETHRTKRSANQYWMDIIFHQVPDSE